MNQVYKLQNGHSNFESHPIISNLPANQWAYGKIKPFQQDLPKIENEILRSLPSNVLKNISPMLEQVYLNTGEYLYQPEDVINYLYFPETAIISDFQILEDGKNIGSG
ncbi:MAG: hypothetical protein HC846_11705, partial [Blastocatellia bacterium]|nr:hypothetical protein [Blastocatellia bacterium]